MASQRFRVNLRLNQPGPFVRPRPQAARTLRIHFTPGCLEGNATPDGKTLFIEEGELFIAQPKLGGSTDLFNHWLGYCAPRGNPMKLTLQDSIDRAEFYSKDLGCFGVPLIQALTPHLPVRVTFEGQSFDLGSPAGAEEPDPFEDGFSSPRCWAEGCLGWIWCQWLSQTPAETMRKEVEFVVNRGMEMQEQCPNQRYRCLHDLWLLNCAILGASSNKLTELAARVVDSKGDTSPRSKDRSPPNNNGELSAAAWCGMLKYWILGDRTKALQESSIIWGAYRYDIARVAPKALVTKWLEGDWNAFVKLQQKDFAALWERARKNHIVVSETDRERVIAFNRVGVPGTGWCWAHCGLAMLAHRQGVEVATDPFWFPLHAFQGVARGPQSIINGPTSALHRMAAPRGGLAVRKLRKGRHR